MNDIDIYSVPSKRCSACRCVAHMYCSCRPETTEKELFLHKNLIISCNEGGKYVVRDMI